MTLQRPFSWLGLGCLLTALGMVPAAAAPLRVVDWNVHHGGANIPAQVTQIAGTQPDVIFLQEVHSYEVDQFRLPLQQQTGQTWYRVMAVDSLSGSGNATVLLSRFPFTASGTHSLGNNSYSDMRNSAWGTISLNGTPVTLFAIHLDWPNETNLQANMSELLRFASGYSGRKIIAGDFNASYLGTGVSHDVMAQIRQQYTDSLVEFYGSDAACPGTHQNGWRPDSIFHNAGITTQTLRVHNTSSLSDHYMISGVLDVTTTTTISPCDLDANGATNVVDVQRCANQAISVMSCTNGDLDNDGRCNVVDVQRVINAALGGACVGS